ncbi:MAG TPA: hypothetical protein VHP83_24050 [Aggregatilineaceae bacterium]|nr:hypothetical protein [Aggregatilineaceae bacterium]
MEKQIVAAFAEEGITVRRGRDYDPAEQHGFISSQRMGMDVFKNIHPEARLIVAEGKLHADLGRATAISLPEAETERRWQATTPQWPIMHFVLHGVTRDQMMARQKANHANVAYAPSAEAAADVKL